jgi:hypothetical protein
MYAGQTYELCMRTREEDLSIYKEWEEKAKKFHDLTVEPNAWMKTFGIAEESAIEEANKKIIQFHTAMEFEAKEARQKQKKKVMGKKQLKLDQHHIVHGSYCQRHSGRACWER